LFLIGANFSPRSVGVGEFKSFLLGILLWMFAAGVSLFGILRLGAV
jgi:hypothetical protein